MPRQGGAKRTPEAEARLSGFEPIEKHNIGWSTTDPGSPDCFTTPLGNDFVKPFVLFCCALWGFVLGLVSADWTPLAVAYVVCVGLPDVATLALPPEFLMGVGVNGRKAHAAALCSEFAHVVNGALAGHFRIRLP